MAEFVHLHLHTEYSLLDGACRVGELLDEASKAGVPAMAVTEHGNLFSAVVFHDKAREKGIKPILGCEVYVAPRSRLDRSGSVGETNNHLVLLAETNEGFHNLVKLVSKGYTEGFYYRPRIDKELLAQHSRGLIGLSSCLKGEIPSELRTEQYARAQAAAAAYRDILGPANFFLEMQYQGIEEQRAVNNGLVPLARDLGLSLVCTNDVHYLRRDDFKPHDILLCIGTGKSVAERERLRYYGDQFYLKSPEEMWEVFGDYPEALRNTVAIADRCNVDLGKTVNHLPNFDVPAPFALDDYFDHMVREGFAQRLPKLRAGIAQGRLRHTLEEYGQRLDYEIDIIKRMQYPGYFLIVWDFIRYAREHGIPVGPGRGSAAGSLVAYSLRITDVDPLEFDLLFERFLNPERVSLPDIDIDFCERRRGEVIEYVTQKYGRENVAQIITFGTMKARAVVRDVARVMDMPYAEADRVAKSIPPTLDMTLDKALEETAGLREMQQNDPRVAELIGIAKRLEGMTRHASVHAAGVVIAPKAITEFAPLYKGQRDEITTQWGMKEIERIGLLKMDFLGLSTLTLIQDALEQIAATTGSTLDLESIPMDDARTFQVFCEGQTLGIFQFESSGMRDILRRAKPQRLEDLIALNALYRPGPLRGGMVDDYINRRLGRVEITYELPQLEPILSETYGVMAYQEQVMRVASVLAGFTLGEADLLRKAMGKKQVDVMEAQRQKFVKGATSRGIPQQKATKIFDLILHFAGYGFNKSHATTYALLAYRTAYLKANYPSHFMAALLTIESQNTEKLAMYLGECRELGVALLRPDVNQSELGFAVKPEGVRFGLGAVKNVGEGAIRSILDVRAREGRISSLYRLCEEADLRLVNKRVLESLIKAGAFDSVASADAASSSTAALSSNLRARLLAALDRAVEHGNRHQRDRDKGQVQLFSASDADGDAGTERSLPDAPPLSEAQQLAFEKEALGLYLSGHPIDRFDADLRAFGARTLGELTAPQASEASSGDGAEPETPSPGRTSEEVSVGGAVAGLRQLKTRKGDRMCAFTLDDPGGSVEVVVFPDAFSKSAQTIENDALVLVKGRFERDDESMRILASEVLPISAVREQLAREVVVVLRMPPHDRRTLEALSDVFSRHKGDRRVSFEIALPDGAHALRVKADLSGQYRVRPSERLVADIERICGEGSVQVR